MLACFLVRPRTATTSLRDASTVSAPPTRPEEPESTKVGAFHQPARRRMLSPAPGLATDIESLDARLLAGCMKVRFYPLVIRRQRGNRMWDEAGSEYVNFTSGWSVAAVGYHHPKVIEAVTRQLSETSFADIVAALNEPSVRLAQRLVDLVPGSYSKKVWFGLSG